MQVQELGQVIKNEPRCGQLFPLQIPTPKLRNGFGNFGSEITIKAQKMVKLSSHVTKF